MQGAENLLKVNIHTREGEDYHTEGHTRAKENVKLFHGARAQAAFTLMHLRLRLSRI